MTLTEKSLDEQYKPYLIKLMSFKDGVNYASDREFTNEELAQITPETIVRWMCVKAYGIPDPGPNDNPTEGRSSALAFAKKAISYFMPNRCLGMRWQILQSEIQLNP